MEVNIKINDHPKNFVTQKILTLFQACIFFQNNIKQEFQIESGNNLEDHMIQSLHLNDSDRDDLRK